MYFVVQERFRVKCDDIIPAASKRPRLFWRLIHDSWLRWKGHSGTQGKVMQALKVSKFCSGFQMASGLNPTNKKSLIQIFFDKSG